ncbi:hypothetical protein N0V82_004337 [Gnomoniopsis sp. IMI 355080]|nr:hypothetical protein N0V82_004337 [Gnomoniopsis sp. IMI 355080]
MGHEIHRLKAVEYLLCMYYINRTSQPDNFGSNPFTDTDSQDESSAYRDDVDPGDSASAAAEYSVHHNSRTTGRPLGQHSIQLPSPPRRYYYPVAAPKPFVGSRAMSLLSSSDGYGDVSPPPPPPRRMTTFSSRSASRLTPSIAHTGPYAPPSVYAPPYGQMVPYAGQPRPFQGPSDYYQGPYYSPDYHYYPPLPTDDPPFLPIPGPIKAKRPDRDPDLLKMEADLEKLQLDRKKAELEESIHKEKELRDKRDSARRAHEPAALGAKPDQGEIGKIVMEQLKEVKSQLAQLTKSALDANQASPESPKISRRPSLKRRTFPEEQGTASYGGFERGLYEDGQDLEQLKKRFSTPRKKGGALDSKAQSKPPDKRRRVDFASAEPREQVRIRGRTAAEAPHGQTRPAMGMRTPSTMSGALPVELDPKPRIAAKLSSRSHGLEDTGIPSEDEAYEEDIFAKKAYKKPASAKGAIEKVVYIEDVSIEEADPASGRATTNAPPNEEESEEPVEEVLEEDTSEVMSGQPEIALESPRSHSDASQENPEASIATGTGFYDSDSLTVEEGFAARTSSTQHRTSSFPQSSGNSNRFANRASAPDNRPPKSSELVSGFDALRLERSLSGAVYKAIVDAFQKNALSLLQIARPQVAVGETQRPLNQHPFDTAYLPPEHKASVESVVTMQNINGRHETLHGGRNPMPSGATGDHNHPHVAKLPYRADPFFKAR